MWGAGGVGLLVAGPAWAGSSGQIRVDVQNMPGEIVLDGFLTGQKAPAVLEAVEPGVHEVQIEYGCLLGKTQVTVQAGATARARIRVKNRGGVGTVRVRDVPPWAEAFVDGRPMPSARDGEEVACGGHRITVEASGMSPWQDQVVVTTGQWTTVTVPSTWEGMEGDLNLVVRSDDDRGGRSEFDDMVDADAGDSFDDWEEVDPRQRDQEQAAEAARQREARAAQEKRAREEAARVAKEIGEQANKLAELKLAREEAVEAVRDAEGRVAEIEMQMDVVQEALAELGAAPVKEDRPEETSTVAMGAPLEEGGDLEGLDGRRAEIELQPAVAKVDRGQARLDRQRRRQEEAEAERRAEEERKRLQNRLSAEREGRSKDGDWTPEDYESSLDGLDSPRAAARGDRGGQSSALSSHPNMRLGTTGASAALAGTGVVLAAVGFLQWNQAQGQWDTAVQMCDSDPNTDFDQDGVSDCPYTDNVTIIPSEHALAFRQDKLAPARKRAIVGVTLTVAGAAGAGAAWTLLDVGPSGAAVRVGGRW